MTFRRIAISLLFLAGAGLIALGVQNWLRNREAAAVVDEFLTAIRDGNRDAAVARMQTVPGGDSVFASADSPFWKPAPDVDCRISDLKIDGEHALAKVRIERDGFVLEPTLHLVLDDDSTWKITRIENLKIDPQWLELQREAARQQGIKDAGELRNALKDRGGVTVQRNPLPSRATQ